jgi:glycine cleavage system aminomethyltransferase T/glycine/D-amino acid oxidase-like deaminating enzyme
MSALPARADVVVIGAGIVGNCMAYHLAEQGWRNIVLLDKGTLPSPGGSTGHASNFIFLTDHSKEMTAFTVDSARQYREFGVYDETGGIEVARTPQRMEELKRRMASSTSWGIEGGRLLTPAEVKEMVPFIEDSVILGGFYTPGVGIVDSLQAGTLMRQKAQEMGALTVAAGVEVTGVDVVDGHVRGVRTDQGDIAADTVVVACGVWSPRIARMAGASIPLTPAVHQMIDIGPVPQFESTTKEVGFPIVRDMDTNMYERQHGTGFEVGSYAHRAILMDADEIPSIEASALSPTMLPFTKEDFDPQLEDALELFPEIVGDESVGVKLAINGLLSLTPDGNPIIGETPEVKGFWSAAAIWIKEAPGIAKAVAEWMTTGEPEIDPHGSDIARFYDHHKTAQHIAARASEGFNKTYGIVHPMEQWASNRPIRLSPAYDRHVELGAEFFEAAGWERPYWYGTNEALLGEYGDRVMPRQAEWESRWWSPIINAEHLAMRDRAGLVDLSAFAIFDVTGPGALAALERIAVNRVDVAPGRTVYTPLLNSAGGILADLTIMRLAHDRFRVVTGGGMGMRDKKIFQDAMPADGSAQLHDVTNAFTTFGLWGPRARDILGSAADGRADISHKGFPFLTSRMVEIDGVRTLASRISYVGELGWEIYVPIEQGLRVWDAIWRAGQPHGLVPVGIGTYAVTSRLEKGYRAHGAELELEFDLVEAGMARPTVKDSDFVGREAYLRQRDEPPAAILCTLTVDDPTSKGGVKRYMLGREPILAEDGSPLIDAKGRRSYVTSAGSGPSVGKHLLMSYLPPAQAVEGTRLQVEYFGERYPVTVAIAGSTPLFDPDNERIRS